MRLLLYLYINNVVSLETDSWESGELHFSDIEENHFDPVGDCEGVQEEINFCHHPECEKAECKDCIFDDWSEWTPCDCYGLQFRHRLVAVQNNDCGDPCTGNRIESQACESGCGKIPIDCKLDLWTPWSGCTKTCNGGEKFRERTVLVQPENDGISCTNSLKEVQGCNTDSCMVQVDCVFGEWEKWTPCEVTCGGGQQTRSREIASPTKDGGKTCDGNTEEITGCAMVGCGNELDCVWGEWYEWSACNKRCGGGSKERSRMIDTAPRFGGKLCEPVPIAEVAVCNDWPCDAPIDCEFGDWHEWHDCTCSCNGIRQRSRSIHQYPQAGGKICSGAMKEVEGCNADVCAIEAKLPVKKDCIFTSWGPWAACSQTCGYGTKLRYRKVEQEPSHGGDICHETSLQELVSCYFECDFDETGEPQVDCSWGEWELWGECSETCGEGQHQRARQIEVMPSPLGKACQPGDSIEVAKCAAEKCKCEDCIWGEWGKWSACNCTGLQKRHRRFKKMARGCGKPCEGPKVSTKRCLPDCHQEPVDCKLAVWTKWTNCTVTCGGGTKSRQRTVEEQADNGGKPCCAPLEQVEHCGTEDCYAPIDCVMSGWNEWTKCSTTCDSGEQTRTRSIVSESKDGGRLCGGELKEIQGCSLGPCGGDVDCVWGEWSDFSACSTSCGSGFKSRDRDIATPPRGNGQKCEALVKSQSVTCNAAPCVEGCIDAIWSDWSSFSLCSGSCGGGYMTRDRCIQNPGNHCGKMVAGPLQEYRPCNVQPCKRQKVDCEFCPWSKWSDCSCVCNGIKTRERNIQTFNNNNGEACTGSLRELNPCNTHCVDFQQKDCELSQWSSWTDCSADCNGGTKSRNRMINQSPENGGKECEPTLEEVMPCNDITCTDRKDCLWGEWTEWGSCTKPCSGGERNRYRHIKQMPKNNGVPCHVGDSVQIEACNEEWCGQQLYCGWGPWISWGACSTTCGDGIKKRSRNLVLSENRQDEVVTTGILAQLSDRLLDGSNGYEQFAFIYMSGFLTSALLFLTVYAFIKRRRAMAVQPPAEPLEMELLNDNVKEFE